MRKDEKPPIEASRDEPRWATHAVRGSAVTGLDTTELLRVPLSYNSLALTRIPSNIPRHVAKTWRTCSILVFVRVGPSESLGLGPSDALSVGLAILAPLAPAEPCLAGGGAPSPLGGGAG